MTVRELYMKLDERIPRSLSCEWDKDGLRCCPDSSREIRRVLVALDVTAEVVERAIEGNYDAIISHHPFMFNGLKVIDDTEPVSAKALKLSAHGIAVMSFHTRLDCSAGGVNDTLCGLLGLQNTEELFFDGLPLGRIGSLPQKCTLQEFASKVKEALGCPFVLASDGGTDVQRVALVGGSGGDVIETARASGADTFLSGRVGYHEMTDSPDNTAKRMNIIEAGHFYTEHPVCAVLKRFVTEIDESIVSDVFVSLNIKAI